jgi:prepilin-type N-terminal cleavage/methylation domain-containing protein
MKALFFRFGFTLVELMVVISIMALLFGVGLAKYNQFNQSRKIIEAAKILRSDLTFARSKALAGDKSGACTGILEGWYIKTYTQSYDLGYRCGGVASTVRTVNLSPVTVSSAEVLFRPSTLGASSSVTFTLSYNSYQEIVAVSTSGAIN